MKHFKTSNSDIICECRNYLCFYLPSELLAKRHDKFLAINLIVNNRRMIVIVKFTTAIMLLMILYMLYL